MPIPILLDTDPDILGDIDDALCLAYLLAQPECELLGVATVSYDTQARARVASALCQAAGKRVPIFPGAGRPLIVDLPAAGDSATAGLEQAALLSWPHEQAFAYGQAVEYMRRTIRERPGEVTLLAVGPLTNVALLFSVDPEIPSLLRSLHLMCGDFSGRPSKREWNALVDPHATSIVYRADVAIHRSVGLDVTERVTLDAATFGQHFKAGNRHPLYEWSELWFRRSSIITFHDPLAAATLFDESLCGFQAGRVDVELAPDDRAGLTRWTADGDEVRREVAVDVDADRFFEHFFNVLR